MKILAILAMGLSIFGGRWDGRARFTAIDVVGGVEIRSFDPVTGEGFKMKLPHNLEIETVGGGGESGFRQKSAKLEIKVGRPIRWPIIWG